MDESYTFTAPSARARTRSARPLLIVALVAFVLGVLLTWYLVRALGSPDAPPSTAASGTQAAAPPDPAGTSSTASLALRPNATPTAAETAADARQAVQRVEQVAEQQGGIDQRVAAMEQRLTRLDLQAQAAAGNASRAEGLLITFAARRAIERGDPLGYLADQLRLRFGDALPNAVDAVTAAGENPVTVDRLLARLEGLAPELSHAAPEENALTRLGRELSELFVIRSEDTPSPLALDRLQRARLFLESGRIDAAVGEVRNMPNAQSARRWIADAQRLDRALRGLDLLETTAILEPRRMRDGAGETVEQPSPAG